MKGQHKPGYTRPRQGQKRQHHKPLKVDRLPLEVRDAIQKARAAGRTWAETTEAAGAAAAKLKVAPPSEGAVRRWHDLRIAQVQKEVFERDVLAEKNLRKYFGRTLKELPEAAAHALKAEVFGMMGDRAPKEREQSIASFLSVLSDLIDAQAKEKRAEIEERKVNLAQKKFEDLKSKAEKELNAAERKIGKGKELTVEDVNRIRRKVFGLGPAAA